MASRAAVLLVAVATMLFAAASALAVACSAVFSVLVAGGLMQ